MTEPAVTFYWRPGCPFCTSLRARLQRLGIELDERNIWQDEEAARAVRAANRGNETVPTVMVGSTPLTNPSPKQVLRAARAQYPGAYPGADEAPAEGQGTGRDSWLLVLLPAVAIILLWLVLAVARPEATFHLAPLLTAGIPAWIASRPGGSAERAFIVASAAAGGAITIIAATFLEQLGMLAGPALLGLPNAWTEAVILALAGSVLSGLLGVWRSRA